MGLLDSCSVQLYRCVTTQTEKLNKRIWSSEDRSQVMDKLEEFLLTVPF